jgi:hypothetical protein
VAAPELIDPDRGDLGVLGLGVDGAMPGMCSPISRRRAFQPGVALSTDAAWECRVAVLLVEETSWGR